MSEHLTKENAYAILRLQKNCIFTINKTKKNLRLEVSASLRDAAEADLDLLQKSLRCVGVKDLQVQKDKQRVTLSGEVTPKLVGTLRHVVMFTLKGFESQGVDSVFGPMTHVHLPGIRSR